jgi:hypothetical protein
LSGLILFFALNTRVARRERVDAFKSMASHEIGLYHGLLNVWDLCCDSCHGELYRPRAGKKGAT